MRAIAFSSRDGEHDANSNDLCEFHGHFDADGTDPIPGVFRPRTLNANVQSCPAVSAARDDNPFAVKDRRRIRLGTGIARIGRQSCVIWMRYKMKGGTFDKVTSISTRARLLIAIGGTLLCVLATRAQAQSPEIAARILPPVRLDLLSTPPNECGFTLGDLLDQKLWGLVQHPLQLGALNQIGESIHRPPRPGVQFEMLRPGAGITLHFRW